MEGGGLEDGVVNVITSALQSQDVCGSAVTDGPSMLKLTKSSRKKQISKLVLIKLYVQVVAVLYDEGYSGL